ncbi:MAG: hypothetical protein IPJ22_13330 [Bacteroidetes bacterium]|nr:hypothetical protein [Bacteroidota bacterium]
MKFFMLVSFFIIIVGCKSDLKKREKIELITQDSTIQGDFNKCLEKSQNIIERKFSRDEFFKYFSLNKRATGFEYDNSVYSIRDTLKSKPNTYQIFYDFSINSDTISFFRIDFDSLLRPIYYEKDKLIGFRLFADNKLKIGKKEATKIALENGIYGEESSIAFRVNLPRVESDTAVSAIANENSDNKKEVFYWEMLMYCDGCNHLNIDAKDGRLIYKGKMKASCNLYK